MIQIPRGAQCPLPALSGHSATTVERPLFGATRTSARKKHQALETKSAVCKLPLTNCVLIPTKADGLQNCRAISTNPVSLGDSGRGFKSRRSDHSLCLDFESALCGLALFGNGCFSKPAARFGVTLRHALTFAVHNTDVVHCLGVAEIGCLSE
jgi:hypothetical protein